MRGVAGDEAQRRRVTQDVPEGEAAPTLKQAMNSPSAAPRRRCGKVSATRRTPGMYVPANPTPSRARKSRAERNPRAPTAKSAAATPFHAAERR